MTADETLRELSRLRRLGRADRVEHARQISLAFQQAAVDVKNGTRLEDLPDEIRELLLSCSDAVFTTFERMTQRAPRISRGHQFTHERKVSQA